MRLNILSSKDIQSGNIIDYTSRKKEELDQNCSWFPSKSNKQDLTSKFSQAEPVISPDFEVNDLHFGMNFGNRVNSPWGDGYLALFDDEDICNDLDIKFEEKENQKYTSDLSNSPLGYCRVKADDSHLDCYDCTLKKTDVYDQTNVVTSTNLADVLPISYTERMNIINYSVQPFMEFKNKVKEKSETHSLGSYVINSCDLNIGREETVDCSSDSQQLNDQEPDTATSTTQCESSSSETDEESSLGINFAPNKKEDFNWETYINSMSVGHNEVPSEAVEDNDLGEIPHPMLEGREADLKLELSKNSLDNSVVNLPTPDLDFMDFVNYINNEMLPDATASPLSYFSQPLIPNDDVPPRECLPDTVTAVATEETILQEPGSLERVRNLFKPPATKTIVTENQGTDSKGTNPINSKVILDSKSIAERVKAGSARKRSRKLSVTSKDMENYGEDSDKSDNNSSGDDYGVIPRKRKCRSKSRNSESTSSSGYGEVRSEYDSYRHKRDKNNEASRRSRKNKKDQERLMTKIKEKGERDNAILKERANRLEKVVTYLRELLLWVILKKNNA